MFFGKREPQRVTSEELPELLNSLFGKKLGQLEQRASHLLIEMDSAKSEFYRTCDMLDALDIEPYTEDLWAPNVNSIKSKKGSYVTTLRQTMDALSFEAEDQPNAYYRYSSALSNMDQVSNDLLKVNANYKIVLYSYGNEMSNFKKVFATMERLRESLRKEIEGRSAEAAEYGTVSDHIRRLEQQAGEIAALDDSARALNDAINGKSGEAHEKDVDKLSADMTERKSAIAKINSDIASLTGRIGMLMLPLERSARKFDHVAARKRHLSPFISDPAGTIVNESEYNEFRKLMQELRESIGKGEVEAKNPAEVSASIQTCLDSDIFGMVNQLKSLRHEHAVLEGEMSGLENVMYGLQKGRQASEDMKKELASVTERKEEAVRTREATIKAIESLFQDYYGKSILITR